MTHALVIDDEPAICQCFQTLFAELCTKVTIAPSAEDGLKLLKQQQFDVVVLDVRLPGMYGAVALPLFRELTDAPIIVMTAHGTLSTAVSVIHDGAFEYLPKPFELEHVSRVLQRAIAQSAARRAGGGVPATGKAGPTDIVGDSIPMQQLFRQIALAAQHDAPVLITGESGTGKELVARAIHRHSRRRLRQIVPVHLASLNESLMERELFGHSSGAFTGATDAQNGLIFRADGGTLFLDEIGETPVTVQVKLLRTIETGEFYRVGSATTESSDFRLVAATNRSLDYLRSSDTFRADFFYRLATIHIHVPSLSERAEDIPRLAEHFLAMASPNQTRSFSDAALKALCERNYPGNVRELSNVVIRAANESHESEIGLDCLPSCESLILDTADPDDHLRTALRKWSAAALTSEQPDLLATAQKLLESELIQSTLKHVNGNRSAAAQRLGIHRETLREKLTKNDS